MRPIGFALFLLACGGKTDATDTDDGAITSSDTDSDDTDSDTDIGTGTPKTAVDFLGPHDIGYYSAVAFAPNGEVWASGDDASGLYRSTDGGVTWTLITGVPKDQAAYALVFDATRNDHVYAPNHFGRGALRTVDHGTTWEVVTAGLPISTGEPARIYDAAVGFSGRLFLALTDGLYQSDDGGASFTRASDPDLATATEGFTSVSANPTFAVAGTAHGRIFTTLDGSDWTEFATLESLPVTDLAITDHSFYVAHTLGTVYRLDFAGTSVVVNDHESGFFGLLRTRVEVVPGPTANADTVWIGVTSTDRSQHLYFSDDGGQTVQLRDSGLDGAGVFDIAIDPSTPDHVVVSTVGEGLFYTTDAGLQWTRATGELYGPAILGIAEDPVDADHLIALQTEGLVGTRGPYETLDGGATWSPIEGLPRDVRAALIDTAGNAVVGGFEPDATTIHGGIFHRAASTSSWSQVASDDVAINRFASDPGGRLWAVGTGVLSSDDGGMSWTTARAGDYLGIAFRPGSAEMAWCGTTVTGVDESGTPTDDIGPATPGYDSAASCAFDAEGGTLLVGTALGRLYRSSAWSPTGGLSWEEVDTPVTDASIRSILTGSGRVDAWYMSAIAPDIQTSPDATQGVLVSTDEGATWAWIAHDYPGDFAWELLASTHSRRFYAAMWGGGGVLAIDDH
jgi:hypothetical protein